jgi:hypothetical protein
LLSVDEFRESPQTESRTARAHRTPRTEPVPV